MRIAASSRGLTLCVTVLAFTACSRPDPASEPPVQMLPGLYEVSLGGGTVVELKTGERKSELCLDSYGAFEFPKDPLGPIIERWETCSTQLDPPKGNAMSGARKCEQRKTPMVASYAGSHTIDSFEIKGTVSQGQGENASVMHLGSGEFTITGKRVGDCSH